MSWIPLHTHSQYSILDSTVSIAALVKKAKEFGISSLALADHGNLYGAVEFFKECKRHSIKPIIGCEFWVAPTSRKEKKRLPKYPVGYSCVLLAMNLTGYKNLCKLSSKGYVEGFYYFPRIDHELLELHHEGLICLTGSMMGEIPYLLLQDDSLAKEAISWYQNLFGDRLYFELQRHAMTEEEIQIGKMYRESWVFQKYQDYVKRQDTVNQKLVEIGKERNILCVATNDIHYLHREDYKAQEILLNIQSGEPCEIWQRDSQGNPQVREPNPKRKIYPSHDFYFKSPEEMMLKFQDLPAAIENTLTVANRCSLEIDFRTKHYPIYFPPGYENQKLSKKERSKIASDYLYELCSQAIETRYTQKHLEEVKKKHPEQDPMDVVQDRLKTEFDLLSSKGLVDYMLIVYDFINWAKKRKIPVGPGRGSAAGSIVAYLIGITDIEPLRFQLFFERFINPERVSYPDIDVDICMERRSEVIQYIIEKYGHDRVAQIITFGKMKAKMAIKDVGRVLSVPLSKVNAIAKLVPEDPTITLEKALSIDPELQRLSETDEEAKMILDMAKKTEGSIRNTSIHAAGLIISEEPIMEHIPVCVAKDSDMFVTQYAMKPVESVGMLKIDFLGLKTLTSIQKAVDAVEERTKEPIDWTNLPLDDPNTYQLLNHGRTLGVFQLESGGMQELARNLHIDSFEEIIAVGALYRPGPMDMIPSFIARKHRQEKIQIEHSLMKEILEETYGVMVYQEQVMQIASRLAGYSLGEGDVLRRAMGKKDRAEMSKQREKFVGGAKEKGIAESVAIEIFDKIEKFASYGFNKSHAAAYAYLSYTTAYLKANFPKEWMAALMTCDQDDLTKVAKFIQECHVMKIQILPPDVNEAKSEFTATDLGIRFAMSGIKGVGTGVVEAILEEREKVGAFKSLDDFIRRVDTARVGKKVIELLIDAGAFDFTKWSRDALRINLEQNFDSIMKEQKDAKKGVMNFLDRLEESKEIFSEPKVLKETSSMDILKKEKELLGFYLTGHPMAQYQKIIKHLSCIPLKELSDLQDKTVVRVAYVIDTVRVKIASKSQRKFAILTISDGIERKELPIWPDLYEKFSNLLIENSLLFSIIQVEKENQSLKLQCRHIEDLVSLSEESIEPLDRLFDQLKFRAKQMEKKQKRFEKPMNTKSKTSQLKVSLDADSARLSQILVLKKIFCSHPGKTKVQIDFMSQNKNLGALLVDSKWGVSEEEEIISSIKQLPCVINVEKVFS